MNTAYQSPSRVVALQAARTEASYNAAGPACTNTCEPARDVYLQLSELREGIQIQAELLDRLSQRLVPVLSPHVGGCGAEVNAPRPVLAPLAEELRALGERIQAGNELIRSLTDAAQV